MSSHKSIHPIGLNPKDQRRGTSLTKSQLLKLPKNDVFSPAGSVQKRSINLHQVSELELPSAKRDQESGS
jgi:hypothetical protein